MNRYLDWDAARQLHAFSAVRQNAKSLRVREENQSRRAGCWVSAAFFGAGWIEFNSCCTAPLGGAEVLRGRGRNPCSVCGARQKSMNDVWWTQLTVQFGAQYFSVRNSCFTSSVVYSASGTPGKPRCCEQ